MFDAIPFPDPAAPVRYALSHRPTADDRVDIVLDLFRGGVPVLTKTVVQVERMQAVLVMVKCRRYLDLRGVPAAAPAVPATASIAVAAKTAPVPARVAAKSAEVPMKAMAAPTKATAAPMRAASVPSKTVASKTVASKTMPAKTAAVPARAVAAAKPQRERLPETRSAARVAPPAAAFDWMFQAV